MIFPTITVLGLVGANTTPVSWQWSIDLILTVGGIGIAWNFSQFQVESNVSELANGWIIADCVFTVA